MPVSAETTTAAAGLLKQAYAEDIAKVIPASSILQEEIDFVPDGQREGAQFNAPVLLSLPTGFTYGAGFATYQPIIPSSVQYAFLTGSNINLRDGIANDLISRAMTDKNSFMTASKYVMMALQKSMRKELELNLLYGSSGYGQGSVISAVTSTSSKITITNASWAPAIWSGMETAAVSFYNASALVGSAEGAYTISKVDIANKQITVTSSSADATTLVALNGTVLDIYMNTAFGNQMLGLKGIVTASGTLFGLATTSYSVWQPNSFDCGTNPLTLGKVEDMAALAVSRGAEDEELALLINPDSYGNIITEASSARRYDGSYKKDKLTNGARYIEYYGPNGVIRIIAHPFVKQGEGFMLPLSRAKRVGSTDITFDLPGFAGPALYVPSSTNTGVEVRVFTSQALFVEAPSHTVWAKNIVASTN